MVAVCVSATGGIFLSLSSISSAICASVRQTSASLRAKLSSRAAFEFKGLGNSRDPARIALCLGAGVGFLVSQHDLVVL